MNIMLRMIRKKQIGLVKGADIMRNKSRMNILQNYLSDYNLGRISESEFLNHKKSLLEAEGTEAKARFEQAKTEYQSIQGQIIDIDERLAEINS